MPQLQLQPDALPKVIGVTLRLYEEVDHLTEIYRAENKLKKQEVVEEALKSFLKIKDIKKVAALMPKIEHLFEGKPKNTSLNLSSQVDYEVEIYASHNRMKKQDVVNIAIAIFLFQAGKVGEPG